MYWAFLLVIIIALLFWLRPMPVNFLNYMIWKYSTTIHFETGRIKNRGAYIHYVSYGLGPPVLLLHGGLSNKLAWFSQVPWLVASGRRVVLIDTRGHGESTHGNSQLNYRIFAEDTLQVLDRLGIKRTDIIGWSDGGIIALLLGLKTPERVGRIVAISANFHPSGLISETSGIQAEVRNHMQNRITHWLHRWWSSRSDQRLTALENELNKLWQIGPQLKHSDLQAIIAPSLIITGENDIIHLAHSDELAQMLANGKIEIIPGAGHTSLITHARQINELIASFLGIELI